MNSLKFSFLWVIPLLSMKNSVHSKEICFPEIGCFSLEYPWDSLWRRTPKSPEELEIEFYITTRNTKDKLIKDWKVPVTSDYNVTSESLSELDYQSGRNWTVIQIHGWYNKEEDDWRRMIAMADAYLFKADVNIISIRWDAYIGRRDYRQCVSNIRIVAAVASRFIENLIKYHDLTPNQIHIIGVSLGAHLAGYIGKSIPNINRITALDAAQPGFENEHPKIRLHETDAHYVDALHTNSRVFKHSFGLGYINPIGHVDFYFNGGAHQPGCSKPALTFSVKEMFSQMLRVLNRCSHGRAVKFWIDALQNPECIMWGIKPNFTLLHDKCTLTKDYCSPVGLETFESNSRGEFHVSTRSKPPYCIP